MYKAGGLILLDQINLLFQSLRDKEQLPQEFRDATSTRAKETGIPATIIAVSPFSPLLARSYPACCSTASSTILSKVSSSLRASASSAQVKERSTCYLPPASVKKSVWNSTVTSHHLCGSHQCFRHSQQRRIVENHEQVWLPPQIHHHRSPVQ